MDYQNFFAEQITQIRQEGRYREFVPLSRQVDQYPAATFQKPEEQAPAHVTIWCSNDYLGMSQHEVVRHAATTALQQYGLGAGGTRNIAGSNPVHGQLEAELADLHGKEAALLFGCGYLANFTTLSTVCSTLPDCVIFSDEKNHASMIEGIRNSRARKEIFKHNDLVDLEAKLAQYPVEQAKIIVFESVYSMDGDVAPIGAMCDLAEAYNALTFLDEVHAVGLYGPQGAGQAAAQGVAHRVDIIQGTLAKAFGTIGGYIAGHQACVDFVRSAGSGFIFTTAIPPAIAAAALSSVQYVRQRDDLRHTHQQRVQQVRGMLQDTGLFVQPTTTHILPLRIDDPVVCKTVSDNLLQRHQIYVQPINYPTVPKGTERFRLTPSPYHTPAHIDALVNALTDELGTTRKAA